MPQLLKDWKLTQIEWDKLEGGQAEQDRASKEETPTKPARANKDKQAQARASIEEEEEAAEPPTKKKGNKYLVKQRKN